MADEEPTQRQTFEGMMEDAIMEKQDDTPQHAMAWALVQFKKAVETHISNEAVRHSNETYLHKNVADAAQAIASSLVTLNNHLSTITRHLENISAQATRSADQLQTFSWKIDTVMASTFVATPRTGIEYSLKK